jgi:integrase
MKLKTKTGKSLVELRDGKKGFGYYLKFDYREAGAKDESGLFKRGKLRRVRVFGGKAIDEAKLTLAKLKKEVHEKVSGIRIVEKKDDVLVEDFIHEKWDVLTLGKRSNTLLSYENSKKALIGNGDAKGFFKGRLIRSITLEDIESFVSKRITRDGVSDATVNREVALLKLVFRKAFDYGYVANDPSEKVEFAKELSMKDTMRILSDTEARRLIEIASPKLRPILQVFLTTAIRKTELLSLRWSFPCYESIGLPVSVVDLEKKLLWISAELSKNHKSRTIRLSPQLVGIFREIRKTSKSDRVFPFKTFRKDFDQAKEKAKIVGRLRIHDLRHSAISRMIESGVDIVSVSQIAGHSDIKTTMIYCHPKEETKAQAIEKMSAIYLGTTAGRQRKKNAPFKMSEISDLEKHVS